VSGALILPTNLVNAPHWLWIFSWKVTERSWLSESILNLGSPPQGSYMFWSLAAAMLLTVRYHVYLSYSMFNHAAAAAAANHASFYMGHSF